MSNIQLNNVVRKQKSILFLSHYFPPEVNAPANRTFEHCRRWAKNKDISITVVTNFPNHPDGKILGHYRNRLKAEEEIECIRVVRLLTVITANEGLLLRTFNYVFFMIVSVFFVLLSRRKYDIVIATSPQFFCGIAGAIISKVKRIPLILEVRDLWPESIVAVGAIRNRAIISLLERIELWLYVSSSKIVSVTKSFKEIICKKGIDPQKIEIIYNGVDMSTFDAEMPISNQELKSFLVDGFKIGYIGTIGMAHSIHTLVDAAEKMKDEAIKFVIVGSGAEKGNIEELINARNLENIKLFPLIQRNEISSVINELDIFLVHLKKQDLFKTVIPSKIFEGMALKKTILIGVDGEARSIIEDAKCGVYFEPENTEDLINKIYYIRDNPRISKTMGENGYKKLQLDFNREQLANKMLEVILSTE